MSRAEMEARGWNEVDFVFVTGDAYVDHPSFAAALLGRVLEAEGFKVAILAQPDWHSCEPWTTFGRPRLGFCVSAGNMDSMINHYTANRKVRNDDAYSPGGKIGLRPDRATLSYCQRAREAYPEITVIAGGVEASLRRLAHYDYWSDKVKRSILMDSKADILVYGMGEKSLLEIAHGLAAGKTMIELRSIRGTVFRLKASEDLPEEDENTLHLPSCEEVSEDKKKFAEMTRLAYENLNPYNAKRLIQEHDLEAIVVNPPAFPLAEEEMDRYYGLTFTKKPHPSYGNEVIPAFAVIKDSLQIHRGCFGGCAFCSLAAHQGKFVQSRSKVSICAEVRKLTESPEFTGTISDLGGPTANMYQLGCTNLQMPKECLRNSCLYPDICRNLTTDHEALIQLMRSIRDLPGVKQVFIASGVRTDLAQFDRRYLEELVKHHVGGHLKTAPEHSDPAVLDLMNKPPIENYVQFCELFSQISRENGKLQYLVPYMIAGLPGSTLSKMVEVAEFLHKNEIKPQQVQEFIPGPFELATCMYYTGIDPATDQPVYVARGLRERRLQKALLLYYDPLYYHDVKTALKEAGREDLIGFEPHCLIPPYPSKADAIRQSSRIKRLKRQTEEDKRQKEERRRQAADNGRQMADGGRQMADGGRQTADGRRREERDGRTSPTGERKRAFGEKKPYESRNEDRRRFGDRKQEGNRPPRKDGRRQATDGRRRAERKDDHHVREQRDYKNREEHWPLQKPKRFSEKGPTQSNERPKETKQREGRFFPPPRKPRVNHGRPQRGKRTSKPE